MNKKIHMKQFFKIPILILMIGILLLSGCQTNTSSTTQEEVRGIWFSYLDYQEAFQDVSEEAYRNSVVEVLNNMESIHINTIYLHASSFSDAYYPSSYYPKAIQFNSVEYDPFGIFVQEAKKRKMHVEAWINPLRSKSVGEESQLPQLFQDWILHNDERIRIVENRYYLNPAYPEVREYIKNVAVELCQKYPVDGIHFDDYFYPPGVERKFDAYIYSVKEEESPITREDFRRESTNQLVKEISEAVRNTKKSFGISVAGNIDNDLNIYYADPYAWIEQGTIDYLIPQIYWGYQHPTKPYERTLEEWMILTKDTKVRFMVGLAAYKIGIVDQYAKDAANEWVDNTDLLRRQIETAREKEADGFVYFRYGSLFHPSPDVLGNVEKEIINIKK